MAVVKVITKGVHLETVYLSFEGFIELNNSVTLLMYKS